MDAIARLKILSAPMSLEPDVEHGLATPYLDRTENCADGLFIYPAQRPDGRPIKLLKTLLTSACERDCYYCPFRAGRDVRRATFRPAEFARLFMELQRRGIAEGIFLSSGIAGGGVQTQDRLIETAEILRLKLGFRGYLHLKVMPGAERAQVARAMQLANRVSINLEAPDDVRLMSLAPHKSFTAELLQRLKWMDEIRRRASPSTRPPSLVTQFVAGAAGESDLELLSITASLYHHLGLKRVYYSPFHPVPDTPLESHPPTPPQRARRLYQASFLLRDYGFEVEELPFEAGGFLPLESDPKLAWARQNLLEAPLEINRAERAQLLRVPGIGPKGAEAILKARRLSTLRDLSSLRRLGIVVERAAPYILLDGKRTPYQQALL